MRRLGAATRGCGARRGGQVRLEARTRCDSALTRGGVAGTWQTATHVSLASRRWQVPHCLLPRTYSTTKDCCSTAPATTSCCTVSLSLMRRE